MASLKDVLAATKAPETTKVTAMPGATNDKKLLHPKANILRGDQKAKHYDAIEKHLNALRKHHQASVAHGAKHPGMHREALKHIKTFQDNYLNGHEIPE